MAERISILKRISNAFALRGIQREIDQIRNDVKAGRRSMFETMSQLDELQRRIDAIKIDGKAE